MESAGGRGEGQGEGEGEGVRGFDGGIGSMEGGWMKEDLGLKGCSEE